MKTRLKSAASLLLASALTLSLAGCGGAGSSSSTPGSSASTGSSSTPAAITIRVGATPAPHAEILEVVKPLLAAEGITLEIVEFTDYDLPNLSLDEGSIDANFFQHQPFLDVFNEKNKADLLSAGSIHFEPLGLYPGKSKTLEELPTGASIAIPNDVANEARSLQLLEDLGVIKLKADAGLTATPKDIVENPKNLSFVEVQAAQLVRTLPDVELAVINGNYAVEAGITDTVLATEAKDSEGAVTYGNIVAVRKGDEARPEIQKLIVALKSATVRSYIETTYNGTVVPLF